jgi:glyoxylase-like metal-dependent hydrolase (beta-lactamase superfamily II)
MSSRCMQTPAGRLLLFERLRVSNVWLLEDGRHGRFLVDTGHPLERPLLAWSLWRAGVRQRGDLQGILLTHRHSDHAGNAAWLRERFGCPVVCHPEDARCLTGERCAPPLRRGLGPLHAEVLCAIEDRFPARCVVDDMFEPGRWKWGFQVVHVPGHTEGSVMLHHEPSRVLFSGDSILAGIPPLRFVRLPSLAVPAFSVDVDTSRREVRSFLKALPPTDALCAGHGPLIDSQVEQHLRRLLGPEESRLRMWG